MYQFSNRPPVTVVSRRSCLLTASRDVEFLCLITHLNSFSHFGSSWLLTSRWPGHTRFGHVFFMCIAYPYHFNVLFSSLSKIICVTRIFLRWLNFLILVVWRSLQCFSKNPCRYLIFFSLNCTPVSIFPNRNLKYFLSLYKIYIYFCIYRNIYIYTRVVPKLMPPIYFHGNYTRYKEHNNTIW